MNIEAFLAAPLIIQVHAASAIAALALGAVQLIAPKGTLPHRQMGYVWAGLMLSVAGTAFFIRHDGGFSWLHLLIPVTLFGLYGLIRQARKGLTGRHRITALTLVFAALVIPGAFSFLPGRLMHQVVAG